MVEDMDDSPLNNLPKEGVASGFFKGVVGESLNDKWEIRQGAPLIGPS